MQHTTIFKNNNMNSLLSEAKKRFKKGDLFITATKKVKVPMVITELMVAVNFPNTIVNEAGGVVYMEDEDGNKIWAEHVK